MPSTDSFAASLLALGEVAGYLLESVLGSGTYGVVLKAKWKASGTPCALKIFKKPLVKTDSLSLDSAWASLTVEARALESLGAAVETSPSTALASSSSSSSSSSSPSGIPRLFEYGIIKAKSRSKGPGGAAGEGEEEEDGDLSVDATNGDSDGGGEKIDATAADDEKKKKKKKKKTTAAAADKADPAPSDPSPDAVCYAWMSTELLGSDLWHLMRDTKQRAKAKTGDGDANRRACKLSCRALLSELAPAMLEALQQVHSRGLVHRDVKLDNFCVAAAASAAAESGGNEKEENKDKPAAAAFLLDFGGIVAAPSLAASSAAVDHASRGRKTCFFGTPEYCCSTAFTGESPPTAAQDIEALGYCLLELWCGGRLPWGEAFRARRETATDRWSSSNLLQMRLARDADFASAVVGGAVPWWLDAWITHAKQQQQVFTAALEAAVARANGSAAAEGASESPPASVVSVPGGEGAAAAPGAPNYRLLRSLLKAGAAQASAEAEVAQEAADKVRIVGASAQKFVKMEE